MELIDLAIVLVAALAAGRVAEAVRIPAVVGEIVVGLALGPTALGLVDPSHTLTFLAELGVLLLLFQVGLGLETEELRAVGTPAVRVAVIGVVVPFAAGYAGALALGVDGTAALFLGATLVATSVGITARTFGDLGALDRIESRVVLGAAVADELAELDRPVAFGTEIVAPGQRPQRIAVQDVLAGEADRAVHLMGDRAGAIAAP